MVLRTTVLKGSVFACGIPRGVDEGSVSLRIVSCLISVDGRGDRLSTLGLPSEGKGDCGWRGSRRSVR